MVRRLIGGGHQLRGPADLMGDRTMELRIFTDADAVAAEAARLIAAEARLSGPGAGAGRPLRDWREGLMEPDDSREESFGRGAACEWGSQDGHTRQLHVLEGAVGRTT